MKHPVDLQQAQTQLQQVWMERSHCCDTKRSRHLETKVRELSQIVINHNTQNGDK